MGGCFAPGPIDQRDMDMRSFKIFALAAAASAVLATGHARAADMPPLLPPPPMIEEYGGWYLRGDIGMTNQLVGRLDNVLFDADTVVVDKNFEAGMLFGLGIGYRHNSWFRWDIAGEYRGETGFHGMDITGGGTGSNDYSAKKSEWLLMWNAYLDLGTWKNITPFIGAGIGASRISIHSFRDRNLVTSGLAYADTASKWNFAWALHAGLAYDVTPNFTIELAYRYIDLGDGRSGDIIPYTGVNAVNNPMHFKNITSHDVKLGMRWALADMGISHWAPQPPIYSKY
jgi:opacity protein-like surface antigen